MQCKRGFFRRVGQITLGLLFLTAQLYGQVDNSESLSAWVLYEKALAACEDGRLGDCLDLAFLSAGEGEMTPEAEALVGRIYEMEGDYLLAEDRYRQALEKSRFLYVPEEVWDIKYSLARIALNQSDYEEYEQILLSIFDEEVKRNVAVIQREHSFVQVLKEQGLDKLILLYREELSYSFDAASQLGVYYSKNGEWKSSIVKNLYTVISYYTTWVDALIEEESLFSFPVDMDEAWDYDPDFLASLYESLGSEYNSDISFSRDLKSLELDNIENDLKVAETELIEHFPQFEMTPALYTLAKIESLEFEHGFDISPSFYRGAYYLALALKMEGYGKEAEEIWTVIALSGQGGQWKKLSLYMLNEPNGSIPSIIY